MVKPTFKKMSGRMTYRVFKRQKDTTYRKIGDTFFNKNEAINFVKNQLKKEAPILEDEYLLKSEQLEFYSKMKKGSEK